MQKLIKGILPLIVAIGAIWVAYVALFGRALFDLSDQELQALQGCYAVSDAPIFEIKNEAIVTETLSIKFRAVHEKGVDNLLLERGVHVRGTENHPQLAVGGTVDKITVIYDRPIRMRLYSTDSLPVEASKSLC